MKDLDEYELQPRTEPAPEKPSQPIGWWIGGVAAAIAAGAAVYFLLVRQPPQEPGPASAKSAALAQEAARPLGGDGAAVNLPPLNESDALVRTLVLALSNNPVVAAWLLNDGLIRNFTVAVANIAEGTPPKKPLNALRSTAEFRVLERGGKSYIEPRNYDRYTPVANAVASIDPAGAAKLYSTLKPRIEEAYAELGSPDRRFDQVLEQAIVTLLRTPTPDGPVQVVASDEGIGYAFADRRLERLSESQKPLLRMGPNNARLVKTKLREIALALGIPASRLPSE